MQRKLLPFAAVGLTALLSACAIDQQAPEAPVYAEDVVLPLNEIELLLTEYRTKALDEPTVENLANLNRILTIRERNIARINAEKERLARAPYGEKHRQVSRDHALDWDNMGRGGAAMRQPAYVHTLSGYNNIHKPKEVTPNFGQDKPITAHPVMLDNAVKMGISFGEPNKPQSYSIYEMSRWERFCKDEGKNMDKRDWAFVKKEGANNLPQHLRADCNPPRKVL
jgi:hypothetical protein